MSSHRGIIVLAAIFVVLGVYVFLFEIKSGNEEETVAPPGLEKPIDVDPDQVREIVLKRKGVEIDLKLEAGRWKMEKPLQLDVAKDRIDELLRIFGFGIVRVLPVGPGELSQFGLDHPEIELSIKSEGDEGFETLLIGFDSADGINCFGKVKNQSPVLLLGILYKSTMEETMTYFTGLLE